jgi:glucokinase
MITLAADFGGRRIKLGLIRDGIVGAERVIDAKSDQPLASRLVEVADELRRLCSGEELNVSDCSGLAFAYPSIIDTPNARILDHFGKFGNAAQLDLRRWALEQFGLPFAIDNDARMALIGEWQYGAGRSCDNVAILTLGTGLGTSAVIEGKVLRGTHGQAGILGGHTTINHRGQACVCGNIGCAETEASTWKLQELAAAFPEFDNSALAKESLIDYAAVFRLAGQSDPGALALREHSLKVWSVAVLNLIHSYDPEKVILAGGIMRSASVIVPAIQEWVQRHAHTPWGKVQVVPSTLGDHAALLAGEWLLKEQGSKTSCETVQLR